MQCSQCRAALDIAAVVEERYVVMGILAIALFVGLSCSLADGRQCQQEDVHRVSQCNVERGISDYSLNLTAVLQFCRSAQRESLLTCYTRARGGCTVPQTTAEQRILVSEFVAWTSKSLEYFCSQHSVIEANQGCVDTAGGSIQGCDRSAREEILREIRQFAENNSPPSFEDTKRLAERLGRNREECVYNLLRTNCTDGIAKVYGNFLYGLGVYAFDEANQRH